MFHVKGMGSHLFDLFRRVTKCLQKPSRHKMIGVSIQFKMSCTNANMNGV